LGSFLIERKNAKTPAETVTRAQAPRAVITSAISHERPELDFKFFDMAGVLLFLKHNNCSCTLDVTPRGDATQ
jgi:hypothetical protein